MTRNSVILCFWLMLYAVGLPRQASALNIADFADYSLRGANNQVLLPGRLYTPPEAQLLGAAPRPLIINLHGSGGNGTDNSLQLGFISDMMVDQAKQRGAFIYAPQATSTWSSTTITSQVMTMIDRAISTLNADTHRIYITGYSQGSYGTWTMLSRYDGRFAAAIPISGGVPASDFVAARLVDTPIFALHARDDATASVSATRTLINNILAADGQAIPTYLSSNDTHDFMITNPTLPIHQALSAEAHQYATISDFFISDPRMDFLYYERATGGHTGMLGAMSSPEVYEWMFSHTTAVPEPNTTIGVMTAMLLSVSTRRARRRLRLRTSEPGRPRPRV
jgi:predicted peptidase